MSSNSPNWCDGDYFDFAFPATPRALLEAGPDFLTRAMHVSTALAPDNAVTAIQQSTVVASGSTGKKLLLNVSYKNDSGQCPAQLFIKFSRDFDDPIRDQSRGQLEGEVKIGLASRSPEFPVCVPRCFYADYQRESGTGILITECVPFGTKGILPLFEKCRDHEIDDVMPYYLAIMHHLGRLAGTQKAVSERSALNRYFAFDRSSSDRQFEFRYSLPQLLGRLERLAEFNLTFPGLRPWSIKSDDLAYLHRTLPTILAERRAYCELLHGDPDYIGLMHWNANIDNVWFWQDQSSALQCGFLDWGGAGQMNIGLALWGALSAAEPSTWMQLDKLLECFATAFQQSGGAQLDIARLKQHMALSATLLGLSWLIDAPAMVQRALPGLPPDSDRFAPLIQDNESARSQLLMMGNFIHLWKSLSL